MLSQKAATIEVTEKMDVAICTKCPSIINKGTLTALQKKMVVVEVEVPMALSVEKDTTLMPPLVEMMIILVHLLMVMLVHQMIHLVQFQKVSIF